MNVKSMTIVPWPKSASTTSARTLATVSFVAAEPSASPNSTRVSATARSACKETPRLHAQRWDARRTMIVHPGKSATICQPTAAGKSVSLSVCQATATPMLAARQRTTKKFALASLPIRETVTFHALKVINQALIPNHQNSNKKPLKNVQNRGKICFMAQQFWTFKRKPPM